MPYPQDLDYEQTCEFYAKIFHDLIPKFLVCFRDKGSEWMNCLPDLATSHTASIMMNSYYDVHLTHNLSHRP